MTRRRLLAVLGCGIVLFLAGQAALAEQRALLHLWVNASWTIASFVAAAKAFGTAAKLTRGPHRRAFLLLALGCTSWWLGMLIWMVLELSGTYTPYPSLADVGFLGLAPFFIAAMVVYNSQHRGARIELKHLADVGIAVCLMVLLGSVVFYVSLVQQELPALHLVVALARPIVFNSALVVGLLYWWRRPASARRVVFGLVVGMAVLSAVATGYSYSLLTHAYEVGEPFDVFWILTFFWFTWAAFEEDWHAPTTDIDNRLVSDPVDIVLPALCVGLVVVMILALPRNVVGELRPFLISAGLALAGFVMLREWANSRIEKALLARARLERDRYRELVWNAPLGIASVSMGGDVEAINPLFSQLLGYEPSNVEADARLRELGVAELVREARTKHSQRSLEAVLPDGQTRLVFRAAPAATSVLLIAENVTTERELVQQLVRAQKMEIVSTLAGGIAHDFNNLLTAAMVGSSLARQGIEQGSAAGSNPADFLDQVDRALEQSAALTKRLLTLGRRQAPKLEELDPALIAMRAVELLRLALPSNIELYTSLPTGLASVRADPDQLEQALLNLGLNARDALPTGGTIRIELVSKLDEREQRNVSRVELSVTDDGIGIPAEARERIFEPFFTTKAPGVGTGLGLPMVAAFAERHHGALAVDSRPGAGSRFTLSLPACDTSVNAERSLAARAPNYSGNEHILVVDDNEDALLAAASALRRYGYALTLAHSAAEALQIMKKHGDSVELILTDAVMPGRGGLDMLRDLRKQDFNQPAVLVSAYAPRQLDLSGSDVAYLGKPYRPEQLAALVRHRLNERKR